MIQKCWYHGDWYGFLDFSSENWLRWICGSFGVCCNSGGDAEEGAAAVQLFNFHENQPELQTGCTWQRDLNIKLTSKLEHSKRGLKSRAIPIYHIICGSWKHMPLTQWKVWHTQCNVGKVENSISDWGGEWRLLEKESDISAIWSMFAILG